LPHSSTAAFEAATTLPRPNWWSAFVPVPAGASAVEPVSIEPADRTTVLTYRLEPSATYLVAVDQEQRDLSISVKDPAGATTIYDSPLKRDDRELALIETTTGGYYRIVIDGTNAASASVWVRDLLRADAEDRALRAWRLMSSGSWCPRKAAAWSKLSASLAAMAPMSCSVNRPPPR